MSRIIQLKLNGGLGNQLFQYAFARSCMKNGDILFFNIDSFRNDYQNRLFSLGFFRTKGRVSHSLILDKLFRKNSKLNGLLSKLNLIDEIKENGFVIHNENKLSFSLFTSIDGYWQSSKYFESIRTELLQEFKLKMQISIPDFILSNCTVSVHVRRTDYLNHDRYGFLGEGYYRTALDLMKLKVKNATFIFFSDDITWCKEVFGTREDVRFYQEDNKSDCVDLILMSKCKHQIIANSSYSWWAAWLNSNEEKIVIRPSHPFRDESLLYEQHYPKEWISVINSKK